MPKQPPGVIAERFSPFFSEGGLGLIKAMGFTFIALQGFDLIAAVAGEVKEPGRNLPRAMIFSLLIAIGIYLPLLFLVAAACAGPGESIVELSRQDPEGIIALAARRFLGDAGFWLVKGYLGMNISETLKTWTMMECLISVCGLAGALILGAFL